MEKFISRDKLSKKARKELDAKARVVWQRNPATRCPAPSRAYDRSQIRRELQKETRFF